MTNTINNVPRELLADLLGNDHDKRIIAERHLLAMLANTPSPAGVDGWDVAGDILEKLSAAQTIIDGLRGEVERLQMQLAACGVVALANTIESAGDARQMHPDYMSASCSDVADAVDREIALRTERDQQTQRIGELEGLLYEASGELRTDRHHGLRPRIAAALSAGKGME